jgi:hypothetical protein
MYRSWQRQMWRIILWHPVAHHLVETANGSTVYSSFYNKILKVIPFKYFSTSQDTTCFDRCDHHQVFKIAVWRKLLCRWWPYRSKHVVWCDVGELLKWRSFEKLCRMAFYTQDVWTRDIFWQLWRLMALEIDLKKRNATKYVCPPLRSLSAIYIHRERYLH